MKIRPLSLSDEHDRRDYRQAISALYGELFGDGAIPTEERFAQIERAAESTQVPHYEFGVFAEEDETELIGFFSLAESFATFAGGRYLILGELWVREAERSAGLGAQLIEFCRQWAQEHGHGRIDVTAPSDPKWDRTYSFYQKNHFVPTGRKLKLVCEKLA